MGFYLAQFLTGLASASSLFLVAAGLSIIFGVTRIVNFAHGSFFMLGAYLAYSLAGTLPQGVFGFWGAVAVSALIVGVIGAAIEFTLLSRLYRAPQLFQLVATFALVLIIQDAVLWIWGPQDLVGPRAPGLDGAVRILGEAIPEYDLALIVIGPLVLLAIWWLFYRTRWGMLVRAATEDREMLGALGVNQRWLFTSVFFVGSFLAGLGGALQLPREAISLLMDLNVIAEAFVVVVIGGMGSVLGAYLAAVTIGELGAFGILMLPQITLVLPFLVMAAVLVLRPWGLLGRPERHGHEAVEAEEPLRLPGPRLRAFLLLGLLALALLPLAAGSFTLVLATDLLIAALFAASLHFMMGIGGMTSFGHAAYFGLGAYGAALLTASAGLSMLPSLILGPLLAGLGALLFGWFCVRLSGVYLAMLTLAAAQIVWSVVFQWREVTGGDDGILGVWPDPWAASREGVYYLALVLTAGGIALLWRFAHAPFTPAGRGGRHRRQAPAVAGFHPGGPFRRSCRGGLRLFQGQHFSRRVGDTAIGRRPGDGPSGGYPFPVRASAGGGRFRIAGGLGLAPGLLALHPGRHHPCHRTAGPRWHRGRAAASAARDHAAAGGIGMSLLSVEGVSKSFGGLRALDGLSFDLKQGELLAMIGPNGAGKSTCFNIIGGQMRPDSGRVAIEGREITGLPPRNIWRLGVGRSFQITATFGSMTLAENLQVALISKARRGLSLWPRATRFQQEEALGLLRRVGLADWAARPARELAYGDLKRLELAIALANAPRLLLMDEPTAGMAPAERAALMMLAASLVRDEGLSILFTEHDMDVVFAHASRILVLNRGALIAEGSGKEIRGNPLVREVYLGGGRLDA